MYDRLILLSLLFEASSIRKNPALHSRYRRCAHIAHRSRCKLLSRLFSYPAIGLSDYRWDEAAAILLLFITSPPHPHYSPRTLLHWLAVLMQSLLPSGWPWGVQPCVPHRRHFPRLATISPMPSTMLSYTTTTVTTTAAPSSPDSPDPPARDQPHTLGCSCCERLAQEALSRAATQRTRLESPHASSPPRSKPPAAKRPRPTPRNPKPFTFVQVHFGEPNPKRPRTSATAAS